MRDADAIGRELAEWGKVVLIETHGRTTGTPVRTAVGFVVEPDGSLLVAAGADDADWALNLRHDPECAATVGDRTAKYLATELHGAEGNSAISSLILKYGTPAERLGRGPAFRLQPATS
ncbi:MAG TPA: nitroreductase family deazaflavin-dependent oxidoreductase [Candidatus Limnocylindrales bacterium]|jgi:deazaflavin-dependent oxidoreductase (nitroreductase family)